jgi:hypothetical protein
VTRVRAPPAVSSDVTKGQEVTDRTPSGSQGGGARTPSTFWPRASGRTATTRTLPAASAAAMAFGGSVIDGKAYMAPCGWLHVTPSSSLREATSMIARRLSELMIESRSEAYAACEGSPALGGWTIRPVAIWPRVLEQSEIETSLSSCEQSSNQAIRQSGNQAIKPTCNHGIKSSGHQVIRTSIQQAIKSTSHQAITPSSRHHAIKPSSRPTIQPSSHHAIQPLIKPATRQSANQPIRAGITGAPGP